jgi:predicted negative regulator of RcsB-dependent stress response
MKNTKQIITLLLSIILLLIGFIAWKSCSGPTREVQEMLDYQRKYKQLSDQQSHESAVRIKEGFKNLNKTR